MQQAVKKASSGGFFSSMFSAPGQKFEDAAELFRQAGNQFKLAKNWKAAGDAYCKSADMHIKANVSAFGEEGGEREGEESAKARLAPVCGHAKVCIAFLPYVCFSPHHTSHRLSLGLQIKHEASTDYLEAAKVLKKVDIHGTSLWRDFKSACRQ